jgi:hypothetical protein
VSNAKRRKQRSEIDQSDGTRGSVAYRSHRRDYLSVGTMLSRVQVVRLGGMSMRLAKIRIPVSSVVGIGFYGLKFRACIHSLLLWSIELAAVKTQPYTIDSNTL